MLRLTTAFTLLLAAALATAPDSRADGLEPRVPIPAEADQDGLRPLRTPPPHAADDPAPAAQGPGLAQRIDLRLRPARLEAPVEPGQRLGHGDLNLALPLAGPFQLRPGIRVDYQSRPAGEAWELEGTPMLGVGVRF